MISRYWPAYLSIVGFAVGLSCLAALGFKGQVQEWGAAPPMQLQGRDTDNLLHPIDPVEADALTAARTPSGGA